VTTKGGHMPHGELESHPSWGLVSIHHVHGDRRGLFGSELQSHSDTIRLTVRLAAVEHSLAQDWYAPRETVLAVEMTPAQFAALITRPNQSYGSPCTILHTSHGRVEQAPPCQSEASKILENHAKNIRSVRERLQRRHQKVMDLLPPRLAKKRRDAIAMALEVAVREAVDSSEFVLDSFGEAVSKRVEAAKNDVEAHAAGLVRRVGEEVMKHRPRLALTLLTGTEDGNGSAKAGE
jgi:hypothetical protein